MSTIDKQSKSDFAAQRINDIVEAIKDRESIPKESETFNDLEWIKFYVKELQGCNCVPNGENKKES